MKKVEDNRITADIHRDLIQALDDKFKSKGLRLRGKYGCSKKLYEVMFLDLIKEVVENDELFEYYLDKVKK